MGLLAVFCAAAALHPGPAFLRRSAPVAANSRCQPTYSGGLLGVHAQATLLQDGAALELRGVPLGGRVVGTASFDENGAVRLDTTLERALALRRCRVDAVRFDGERDEVQVWLHVPVFGQRCAVLRRLPVRAQPSQNDS